LVETVWEWLRDESNREALKLIAGGLAAAGAGVWAVLTFLVGRGSAESSRAAGSGWATAAMVAALAASAAFMVARAAPSVTASGGGVAIGGNVSGSTITGGQP
jgi:hypothetical protein